MNWTEIESKLTAHLNEALIARDHPWRYPVLATLNSDGPSQRTVVLRQFSEEEWTFCFYTDYRSAKVMAIKADPRVSLLFYDPQWQWQLRLKGTMQIDFNNEQSQEHLNQLAPKALNDYQSALAPGMPLEGSVDPLNSEANYFCLLRFSMSSLDYLELHREGHRRSKAIHTNARLKWTALQP